MRVLPTLKCCAVLVTTLLGTDLLSQQLSGTFQVPVAERTMRLFLTRGQDRVLIDSTTIDRKGRFSFAQRTHAAGFYQLALSDTDRVDLILSPVEPVVEVRFDGVPLQEHITVVASDENQRLWEYKRSSRATSLALNEVRTQRASADPRDARELGRLDSLEREIGVRRMALLGRITGQSPQSYFAKVVEADRRLTVAIPQGTLAIKEAIDWSDPDLLHSTVYPKALSALLQSATPATGDVLMQASDSLLSWSSGNEECWRYTREFLFDLFTQYSADQVVQYLVDNYVVGPRTRFPPEPAILSLVAAQLRVSVGSMAPDIDLPLPGRADTVHLRQFLGGNAYVVLFFYSSTCDHCHDQMPVLMQLYRELRPRGLEIIGIALDENVEEFDATIRDKGLLFPCYTELLAWGSPAAKAFAVKATPALILLDRQGRIIAKPNDAIELGEMLERLPF